MDSSAQLPPLPAATPTARQAAILPFPATRPRCRRFGVALRWVAYSEVELEAVSPDEACALAQEQVAANPPAPLMTAAVAVVGVEEL